MASKPAGSRPSERHTTAIIRQMNRPVSVHGCFPPLIRGKLEPENRTLKMASALLEKGEEHPEDNGHPPPRSNVVAQRADAADFK